MKALVLRWMLLVALISAALAAIAQTPDSEAERIAAAEKLFELSAYTKLASRQIYEAVNNLAPEQRQAAQQALRDPAVTRAMRQVLTRAMAGTYGVKDLKFLHSIFSAPEMSAFIEREPLFRAQLQREFTAAILTNPALIKHIPPPGQ